MTAHEKLECLQLSNQNLMEENADLRQELHLQQIKIEALKAKVQAYESRKTVKRRVKSTTIDNRNEDQI
jgi:uncharacterized membrane protein